MDKANSYYCETHKQIFCLCQASAHGLIEMHAFTTMNEQFYFSHRDRYTIVFDAALRPIPVLSDLPPINQDQAKWITQIYWAGYLAGRASQSNRKDTIDFREASAPRTLVQKRTADDT